VTLLAQFVDLALGLPEAYEPEPEPEILINCLTCGNDRPRPFNPDVPGAYGDPGKYLWSYTLQLPDEPVGTGPHCFSCMRSRSVLRGNKVGDCKFIHPDDWPA
jgi:hypothetical protein